MVSHRDENEEGMNGLKFIATPQLTMGYNLDLHIETQTKEQIQSAAEIVN
jgi:hypothetical protein